MLYRPLQISVADVTVGVNNLYQPLHNCDNEGDMSGRRRFDYAGAVNAALFAAAILGLSDAAADAALDDWRQTQTQGVADRPDCR